MIAAWYAVVSFMLIIYIVLDGRNFGAEILHWLVAKNPEERRQVIAAIGPLWSWHEVWLVGFGGTLLAVFPKLLASAFAGYYLALFLILWCLILRGISLEVGGQINDHMWQGFGISCSWSPIHYWPLSSVPRRATWHAVSRSYRMARSRWRSLRTSRQMATWDYWTGIRYRLPSPRR